MASRALISLSACLAAGLPLAGATATPEKINGLLNNSPFGQSRAGTAAGANSNDPLEFRAVLEEKGGLVFSVYDTAARRSFWVPLKDSSNGFAVNEYDAAKETVTVDFKGRVLTLPIKRAPAVAQTARPNTPGATTNLPGPNQPVLSAASPVDQQRMNQIQEEIRRRRALREQTAGGTNAVGYQSGPQPAPSSSINPSAGPQPLGVPANSSGPQPQPLSSGSSAPLPAPAKP